MRSHNQTLLPGRRLYTGAGCKSLSPRVGREQAACEHTPKRAARTERRKVRETKDPGTRRRSTRHPSCSSTWNVEYKLLRKVPVFPAPFPSLAVAHAVPVNSPEYNSELGKLRVVSFDTDESFTPKRTRLCLFFDHYRQLLLRPLFYSASY